MMVVVVVVVIIISVTLGLSLWPTAVFHAVEWNS
jgi:hypothetical protein